MGFLDKFRKNKKTYDEIGKEGFEKWKKEQDAKKAHASKMHAEIEKQVADGKDYYDPRYDVQNLSKASFQRSGDE